MQHFDIHLNVNNNNINNDNTINNDNENYRTNNANIVTITTNTTDSLLTTNTKIPITTTAANCISVYTETATNHSLQKFSFSPEYTKRSANSSIINLLANQNILPDITKETSFTILNNDNSSLLYTHKPNAIVHPIRRTNQKALRRPFNDIGRPNDNVSENLHHGSDYDDLRITGTHIEVQHTKNGATSIAHSSHKQNVEDFAKELNKKLYRLTSARSYGNLESYHSKNSLQNVSNENPINQRPLFITTVPRGKFLPPPKEIFLISPRPQKQRIYAYSSRPVVYQTPSYYHNPNHSQKFFSTLHTTKPKYYNNVVNTTTNTTTTVTHTAGTTAIMSTITNTNSIISTTTTTTTTITKCKNRNNVTTIVKDKCLNNEISSKITCNDNSSANTNIIAPTTPTTALDVNHKHNTNNASNNNSKYNKENNQSYTLNNDTTKGQHQPQQKQQYINKHLKRHRLRREIPPVEPYKNVMYDKRVVRGSNFSTQALLSDYDPFDKAAESRRRLAVRKKSTCSKNLRNVLGTPPPVPGRRHEIMQTDKYLEELVVKPAEYSVETQTDLFLEQPPTPPYIPAKVGVDASTEIGDGELFHFEAEAQPIIDVLVDNTIELSILEVAHEQEMSAIRERQDELLALREAELAELRRLEAEEIRLQAERERRLRQDAITKSLDDEMQKEVTTAKLLQGHIASILPEIINNLEPAVSATKKDKLMKALCPWLSAEVATEVGHIINSRDILTNIIKEIIKQRAEIYAGYKEEIEPSEKLGEEEYEACELETITESENTSPLRCPPENTQQ